MFKVALIMSLGLALALTAPQGARISSRVLQSIQKNGHVDIAITFKAKTSTVLNTIKNQSFGNRGARITSLAKNLQGLAAVSQMSVRNFLTSQAKSFKPFWISNQILVNNADLALVQALAEFDTVETIFDQYVGVAPLEEGTVITEVPKENQWGVVTVQAPEAWKLGYTGLGVTVGILDTGVRGTHETLKENIRQEKGWFDAHKGTEVPTDAGCHGTHVMGSIVGRGGIGVAPDAKWIACRSDMGLAYEDYLECGEYFLCPTNPDGSDPDCSLAPHVLSHSWRFYNYDNENFLDETILAWNVPNIHVVWGNGNEGSTCATSGYPTYTNLPLIAVGAAAVNETLADFSSRGPGLYSGEGLVRPNIIAPGVDIVSAWARSDTLFLRKSGTSMATPHVCGVVALMLTNGTHEYTTETLAQILYDTAEHTIAPTSGNCGGIPETVYPNNAVGHGRINAYRAISRLQALGGQ